jgi:uncharacterized cupredoxin-like copper-binding protein
MRPVLPSTEEVVMRKPLAAIALVALLIGVSLAACTTAAQTTATSTSSVQTINVTLTDTAITASQTTVPPGVRCHFIVTNHGTVPHQFWLMPANMAQMMSQMPMMQWQNQILYRTPDIGPGMMNEFDYTFTMPMMQQSLAYGCYTANGQPVISMPMRVSQ